MPPDTNEQRPLVAAGEGMVPDISDTGLSPEQRNIELALVDTLEQPQMVSLGASQLRMEAAQRIGVLRSPRRTDETEFTCGGRRGGRTGRFNSEGEGNA